jgi:hypothetical protein
MHISTIHISSVVVSNTVRNSKEVVRIAVRRDTVLAVAANKAAVKMTKLLLQNKPFIQVAQSIASDKTDNL